jgi:hypothetical protein
MRISALCTAVVTHVVIGHPPPAVAQVDQHRAQEYFKEAQALCERDGGRLWGVSICAPMVMGGCAASLPWRLHIEVPRLEPMRADRS